MRRVPSPGPGARAVGVVRLVHPFPSVLDAVATAVLAALAGGGPIVVATLGASMLALQLAIGATNDLADASRDAVTRPTKPIPSGAVSRPAAAGVGLISAISGLALAATLGPATLAVAAVGLGIGFAYDLFFKPTALSWLPFAAGIPLVPVFAWIGAAGEVPVEVLALALLAAPAGAGLAVANALADLDGDRLAGARTVATVLGAERAWRTATALLGGTIVAAAAALVALGAGPGAASGGVAASGATSAGAPSGTPPASGATAGDLALAGSWLAIAAATLLVAAGVWVSRGPAPARRRLGWGIEAIGVVAVGCGWVLALQAAGPLAVR